ncbi:alpha/beta hydrolase family esterase [Microbacterium trichothecenolyticum]|uniref:Polyhydroxybutyrate depolymerase n=1 Tax=Microbacterium trichothecenolyticum TaxID=69370 RepID=A0ABU0TQG1_MICTR|nr:PHB depolymerase family esterase [Microbacterium trichothecenolyticum]MDQ1121899.1 polyhydroxybutyrate depolymerase [Microbacterium trichothecenolyticum]
MTAAADVDAAERDGVDSIPAARAGEPAGERSGRVKGVSRTISAVPHRHLLPALLAACLALAGCGAAAAGAAGSSPSAAGTLSVAGAPDSASPAASAHVDAAAASGCGRDTSAAGSTSTRTVTVGGTARSARLHVPSGYDGTTPTPVILAFVGHGMSIDKLERFSDLDDSGDLVLYPQPAGTDPQNGWQSAPYASGQDDVAFVSALIDDIEAHACVDVTRVFAAGISNGGGFTALLSCALPARIAAFAVVSGAIYPANDPPCPTTAAVPVVEFHGTNDPVIAYDGGTSHGSQLEPVTQWTTEQAQRSGCSASPTITQIGSDVVEQQWCGCQGRGAMTHYRIEGGGHTWPGATATSGPGATTQTISATRIIEDFFTAHPLPS